MRRDRDPVNEGNDEAPTRIGRYRLLQRVGEGAFARVYFARDEETLAPVALKVLRDDIDPSIAEQVRVRFLAEEKISKAIDHRYVVQIRETSEADARPCFLAMDFIQGRSFCEYLQRLRDPDRVLVETARLGHQVATAMAHSHERGIVHRDLKPDNVLIVSGSGGRSSEVRILDFGIAKAPVELFSVANAPTLTRYWTELGTVMGSPPFMAPEQDGQAQNATGKADVFALGAMLFCSVFGVDAEAMSEQRTRLSLPEDLERMLLTHPLPREWEALLRRMLATEPAERPNMGEVARELQRLARGSAEFAKAVDAWLSRGRIPTARQMVDLMNWAENASYLTEDEELFLRRAPEQRLRKFRRAIAGGLVTGGLLIGIATLLISTSWYQQKVETIRAAWYAERAMGQQRTDALAQQQAADRHRSTRLSDEANSHEQRLAELTKQLERERTARKSQAASLGKLEALEHQADAAKKDFAECESGNQALETKVKEQKHDLERCEVDTEQLFLCRQESAVKDRELIESAERLRLCAKQVKELSAAGAPVEVGLR